MTSFSVSFDVEAHGPVFDGVAKAEAQRFTDHVVDVLSSTGVDMIQAYLPTQYMYLGHHGGTPMFNPVPPDAGALQAAIHVEHMSEAIDIVTDDPVIYGPWIEGVAPGNLIVWPHHRNPPPRRFPGYHTFRKISQSLDAMATPIAIRELPPYLAAMNGD